MNSLDVLWGISTLPSQNLCRVPAGVNKEMPKEAAMNSSLLTKTDLQNIPKLYETEDIETEDKIIRAKLFMPWTNWTWYVIEFDGENQCFGFVKGLDAEFGYFSLRELESIEGPFGLKVERDIHFSPVKVCDLPRW